jgi:pSer/pThr/pTyr-binding forkhead associated (FHA) protein
VIDINGKRHVLVKGVTVIGRGTDADVTVNDSSISRRHVEFTWDGSRAQVRDLGSTNGSRLDGVRLTVAALESGSVIELGSTRVVFHVVPEARGGTGPAVRANAASPPAPVRDAFWSSR